MFVNWEATGEDLLPSGSLPMAIEDEQFEPFITEFAGGARLHVVWHSANIVELTSHSGAASNLTFESYDIRSAISRSFTSTKLLSALRKLLSNNQLADFEKAELGVDALRNTAFYAVLPQSAHKNVLKILSAAERVEKK